MSEPTKDDLLEFMKKHGPESVDSITDKDSAIKHFRTSSKLYKHQRNQFKAERDTLIDDLSWYKAKVSRLERENHDFKKRNALLMNTVDDLDKENKALRLQANTYFDEWQNEQTTSRGLREQCKEYAQDASKYLHLTEHIRLKAENNPGVSRYIDLVNYIDRLERD